LPFGLGLTFELCLAFELCHLDFDCALDFVLWDLEHVCDLGFFGAGTSPAPTVIAKCSGEVYPRLTQVVFGFCHLDLPCPLDFVLWA
jgi:hypothetical protein